MDVVFKFDSLTDAESLIKAKLKVRPTPTTDGYQVRVLNIDKVEQTGLKLFHGTVYKDKEYGTMFTASDPDPNGHQRIRILT